MNVRQLRGREDVRAAIEINGRAWEAAYADVLPADVLKQVASDPVDEHVDRRFDQLLDDPAGFLVAEDDEGEVLGYAHLRWGEDTQPFVGETEAGLKELYVDPEVWGEGVGTALIERGLDELPDDLDAITLEMLDGNEIGAGFFEARGFERVGTDETPIDGKPYPTVQYRRDL
ncbi:acetyltransferase, N-acetylglutamate synthase [Halovivax ruber XH-70]|uniref:Acetyltransferase, N-acetylglutamate synthase n=1 Tax=Halovivax ruber (strain DSM 18193 / JCM 13892 / XH-70) TaxID=797302 RepID=L0I6Q0_HALRX|nr:GNAT family N-acetyltransferase [Halovivax ruber]AGB15220.1 acetyltransferase, N-acetylglutamate synthase [Halovivax ruber XH-70]